MTGGLVLYLFGCGCWLLALAIYHMAHARDVREAEDHADRVILPPRYRGFGA